MKSPADTDDTRTQGLELTTARVAASVLAPALYLIPVPLSYGPVEDVLPARNIEIVKSIRYFIVENVRSARRFLKRCCRDIDIDSLEFVELSEHTDAAAVPPMLEPLQHGHAMGVISEAGCPAVADPGADAVAVAQREGLRVVPLVGPSSVLMALMASGMNGQSFAFHGYLPIDEQTRTRALHRLVQAVQRDKQTQIFIETPYRNDRLIATLIRTLPSQMRLCVAADISGTSESIVTDTLAGWRRRKYCYNKKPTIFLLFE